MSMNKKVAFLKLLDVATRADGVSTRLKEKLHIVNLICQGDIKPDFALCSITIKIKDTNPTVVLLSLKVLDYCVKYCGSLMQNEIATVSYMEQLKAVIKKTKYIEIKIALLRLILAWANSFRNIPSYSPVQEAVKNLEEEGYEFPSEDEGNTEESSTRKNLRYCLRCQVAFSTIEREVHCRSCGKVFCVQCVVQTVPLPEFGNETVLVCEVCQGKMLLSKAMDNINIIQNQLRLLNPTIEQHKQDHSLTDLERIELEMAIALSMDDTKLNVGRQEAEPEASSSSTSGPEQEPSECTICFQREVDSILLLCGHACMCYQCSNAWKDKGNGCCPLCRTVIDEVLHITPRRSNCHPILKR